MKAYIMSINIINPKAIDQYLEKYAAYKSDKPDPQISRWLKIALKKSILADPDNACKVAQLPSDAPDWLLNKWDITSGQNFYKFEPTALLNHKIIHIRDWLVAARKHEAPFIQKTDCDSIPKGLYHLSVESAYKKAEFFFSQLSTETALEKKDIQTVLQFENGYRIVELLTENALFYETSHMGHCIGKGAYDEKITAGSHRYYSLYDNKNKPHVTLEIQNNTCQLVQCFGKENTAPIEKYLPYIQNFLQNKKINLDNDWAKYTGLIKITDKYHSIYNLPENASLESSLYLSALKKLKSLPAGLTVKGDTLDLENCVSFENLGENTTVSGTLNLKNCPISRLPAGLKTELLYLHSPLITALPDDIKIETCADFSNCKNLKKLPDNFKVNHILYLDYCSSLETLPANLKVGNHLYLLKCKKLTSLPENLELHQLDIQGCESLKTLPKTLKAEEIIITGGVKFHNVDKARCAVEKIWRERKQHMRKPLQKKLSC